MRKPDVTIRTRLGAGYVMPGVDGGDMTVYSTIPGYLKRGEHFALGIQVFECFARQKGDGYDRWRFECRMVRTLTKEEFVDRKMPPAVPGEIWTASKKK